MEKHLEERVSHGSELFPLEIYHNVFEKGKHELQLHWHSEMEFLFIEKGEGIFQINFQNYYVKQGDLLVIQKGALHSGYGFEKNGCHCIGIVFELAMLQSKSVDELELTYMLPIMKDELDFTIHIHPSSLGYDELIHYFLEICKAKREKQLLALKGYLYLILSSLFQYNYAHKVSNRSKTTEKKLHNLKIVIQYIHKNYEKSISVKELAQLTHYSEYHFVRFFKQEVGMTCTEYMNAVRLSKASQLLMNTTMPITGVAFETGFENVSYFIKKFKEKYGVTPSKYRKK